MTATGLEARPMPARRGAWGGVRGVQRTAGDGQLFIGVTSDQQWTRFVEEFGLQELAADPRLATNVTRLAERGLADPGLAGGAGHTAAGGGGAALRAVQRVVGAGRPAGRPVSPIRTFWPPAVWSTCSFPALVAATAKSLACRPCRSEFGNPTGDAPAYGASRRAWASTMPRCWAEAGFAAAEIAGLAEAGVIAARTGERG